MALAWIFVGLVREKPDFSISLIFGCRTGRKIVRPPIDGEYRWLSFTSDPELHVAVRKLIAHPRTSLDHYLVGHPLVCEITEAVSCRWEKGWGIGILLAVEAVRGRSCVLEFEIVGAIALIKTVIGAMGGRSSARIIHYRKAILIVLIGRDFESRTRRIAIG